MVKNAPTITSIESSRSTAPRLPGIGHFECLGLAHVKEKLMDQMTQLMQQCIANCTEGHRICTETMAHLLHGGGHHSESKHLMLALPTGTLDAMAIQRQVRDIAR
jgi:hypothetical protein